MLVVSRVDDTDKNPAGDGPKSPDVAGWRRHAVAILLGYEVVLVLLGFLFLVAGNLLLLITGFVAVVPAARRAGPKPSKVGYLGLALRVARLVFLAAICTWALIKIGFLQQNFIYLYIKFCF